MLVDPCIQQTPSQSMSPGGERYPRVSFQMYEKIRASSKIVLGVLKTFWKHHKSKEHKFLPRYRCPIFFSVFFIVEKIDFEKIVIFFSHSKWVKNRRTRLYPIWIKFAWIMYFWENTMCLCWITSFWRYHGCSKYMFRIAEEYTKTIKTNPDDFFFILAIIDF